MSAESARSVSRAKGVDRVRALQRVLYAVGDRVAPFTLAGARVKACLECPPRIRSRFPSM